MREEKKGILRMLACAALWSTAGVLFKYIPWNPFVIAGLRALLAGIVVYAYIRVRRLPVLVNAQTLKTAAAMGMTCLLFVVANKLTTAANAIVLQYTAPVFLLAFSALIDRRRFCRADILAVLLTLAGISLFFLDRLDAGRMLGNGIAVAAGCSMGLMYVFMGDATPSERLSSVLLSEILVSVVGLPFLFFTRTEVSFVPVLFIVLLGVFQIGVPYILYALAAESCPPLACCLLSALEPLLNPVWVLLFYGEKPGPFALAGGAVVIVTITVWNLYRGRKKAPV